MIILLIIIGWMLLGLIPGLYHDKKYEDGTTLRDLVTYGGCGPFIPIGFIFIAFMEWFEKIDWSKPIIKYKEKKKQP